MSTVLTTAPYCVSRFWLKGDVAARRTSFTGVSREATLDSVSLYHRIEREPARWARATGGSVLELHAYAAPTGIDAVTLGDRMRAELAVLWPETAALSIVDRDDQLGYDAPAFDVDSAFALSNPSDYVSPTWITVTLLNKGATRARRRQA